VGGRGKERTRVQSKWRSALHSYLCVGDNHDRFPGRAAEKEVIRHDEQLIAMAPRAEGGEGRSTRTPVLPHSTQSTSGKGCELPMKTRGFRRRSIKILRNVSRRPSREMANQQSSDASLVIASLAKWQKYFPSQLRGGSFLLA
jgi:hypothetical protein